MLCIPLYLFYALFYIRFIICIVFELTLKFVFDRQTDQHTLSPVELLSQQKIQKSSEEAVVYSVFLEMCQYSFVLKLVFY